MKSLIAELTTNWALAAFVFLMVAGVFVLCMMVKEYLRMRREQALGLPVPLGPATARNLYRWLANPGSRDIRDGYPTATRDIADDWRDSDEERRKQYRSAFLSVISSRHPVVAAGGAELCHMVSPAITEAKPLVAELREGWRRGLRGLRLALLPPWPARYATETLADALLALGMHDKRTVQLLQDEELVVRLVPFDFERSLALAVRMLGRGTASRGAYSLENQLSGSFHAVAKHHRPEALLGAIETLTEPTIRTDFVVSQAIRAARDCLEDSPEWPEKPQRLHHALRQLEEMRARAAN